MWNICLRIYMCDVCRNDSKSTKYKLGAFFVAFFAGTKTSWSNRNWQEVTGKLLCFVSGIRLPRFPKNRNAVWKREKQKKRLLRKSSNPDHPQLNPRTLITPNPNLRTLITPSPIFERWPHPNPIFEPWPTSNFDHHPPTNLFYTYLRTQIRKDIEFIMKNFAFLTFSSQLCVALHTHTSEATPLTHERYLHTSMNQLHLIKQSIWVNEQPWLPTRIDASSHPGAIARCPLLISSFG